MTDLLDRMAAADPAREGERPPLDAVWRKIAADVATDGERARRGRWRRHGGRALLIAAAAAPSWPSSSSPCRDMAPARGRLTPP